MTESEFETAYPDGIVDLGEVINNTTVGDVVWNIQDPDIVELTYPQQVADNAQVLVTAINSGSTVLTATVITDNDGNALPGGATLTASAQVTVSNNRVIVDDVNITTSSPDEFTVSVVNPHTNPAYIDYNQLVPGTPAQKVAIFCWSEPDQSDINAKVAQNYGNNVWGFTFPVNDNGANNYFVDADHIQINCYASLDPNSNGNQVAAGEYKAVNDQNTPQGNIYYVANELSTGFQIPGQNSGGMIGTTGQSAPMQGLRISSNIPGVNILTEAQVQNVGWMAQVGDGTYAGTIGQLENLEAVRLTLDGPNAGAYTIQYRAHVANIGWQDWVNGGEIAGTVGENLAMEALEVRVIQSGTPIPYYWPWYWWYYNGPNGPQWINTTYEQYKKENPSVGLPVW